MKMASLTLSSSSMKALSSSSFLSNNHIHNHNHHNKLFSDNTPSSSSFPSCFYSFRTKKEYIGAAAAAGSGSRQINLCFLTATSSSASGRPRVVALARKASHQDQGHSEDDPTDYGFDLLPPQDSLSLPPQVIIMLSLPFLFLLSFSCTMVVLIFTLNFSSSLVESRNKV